MADTGWIEFEDGWRRKADTFAALAFKSPQPHRYRWVVNVFGRKGKRGGAPSMKTAREWADLWIIALTGRMDRNPARRLYSWVLAENCVGVMVQADGVWKWHLEDRGKRGLGAEGEDRRFPDALHQMLKAAEPEEEA